MDNLSDFSAKIKNYKCFGDQAQGFDEFKKINLLIGRNNSGKSALLDLIELLVKNKFDFSRSQWHSETPPSVIAETLLPESVLRNVFQENVYGGNIPGRSHWEFGHRLIGTRFTWSLSNPQNQSVIEIGESRDGSRPFDGITNANGPLQDIANRLQNPFTGNKFKRIFAERNITPESDTPGDLQVHGDGRGVTNIIQNFINKAELPSQLVEITLLAELNAVFKTDAVFTDIVCQQHTNSLWEIYLEETSKGRIPLSQSGSGLKTIILVLVYIHLVPVVEKSDLSKFVFGFEELENNLHPALLRRLLSYLYQQSKKYGCHFFLTTHSNVQIDLFSKSTEAQILHVTHDGKTANVKKVQTYIDNKGILDDLDVRASDLLQSNGIIWVEGPSDRIYLNRWISIWSNGELSEGNHYQCIFYGGRLLAHLSSENPELAAEGVSILKVNRNAAIIIDSDKTNQQSRINDTKKRLVTEIENNSGIAWVTKGKEIENYLPASSISEYLGIEASEQVGQYENFFDYLDRLKPGEGKRLTDKKPLFAEQICPYLTKHDLERNLDLPEKLEQLCNLIRTWNNS